MTHRRGRGQRTPPLRGATKDEKEGGATTCRSFPCHLINPARLGRRNDAFYLKAKGMHLPESESESGAVADATEVAAAGAADAAGRPQAQLAGL